jgi:hypothetical protein
MSILTCMDQRTAFWRWQGRLWRETGTIVGRCCGGAGPWWLSWGLRWRGLGGERRQRRLSSAGGGRGERMGT